MQLFQRKNLVQAFRLPQFGHAADEVPPVWLIRRIQSGELTINSLGGFTMVNARGYQQCMVGDVVLLTDDDTIQFVTEAEFSKFEPVNSADDLRAA